MAEVTAQVRVLGLSQLEAAIEQLPIVMARKIVFSSLRVGGQVIAKRVKGNIRSRTGALVKSVTVKTKWHEGRPAAFVKAGDRRAFYAHMLEGGTRPHKISARPGKRGLAFARGVYQSVDHPGIKAQQFVRHAYEQTATKAVEAFRKSASAQITREWNKASKAGLI